MRLSTEYQTGDGARCAGATWFSRAAAIAQAEESEAAGKGGDVSPLNERETKAFWNGYWAAAHNISHDIGELALAGTVGSALLTRQQVTMVEANTALVELNRMYRAIAPIILHDENLKLSATSTLNGVRFGQMVSDMATHLHHIEGYVRLLEGRLSPNTQAEPRGN